MYYNKLKISDPPGENLMKRKKLVLHIFLAAVLAICACYTLSGHSMAALSDRIRVGIYYGSNALPSANLANEVGNGYQFGYYDSNYQFIALGTTQQDKITVCKDSNLYLSGGNFYETPTASSYRLIGSYHLQTAEQYATFEEALTASQAYPYGFPAYVDGSYVVRFEFYSTYDNASADAVKFPGVQVVGPSATCYTVVNTQTGDILYEFDAAGRACLAVQPDITGTNSPQSWFKGYCYRGSFQYNRRNGNDITVINVVDTEEYIMGVLPYEFVCSGDIESLKAGMVAIRTFACSSTKHRSLDFDVCTTTDCQVYRGVYTGAEAPKVEEAALATKGQCLYYGGKYIQALFYAANGGATEDAANAWGNSYPYLIAQADPYEDSIEFSSKQWSYTVTPAQVRSMLQAYGYSCGEIVSMEVAEYTDVGNVNKILIKDAAGKTITFSRDNVRMLQNISGITYFSRRFQIRPKYEGGSDAMIETTPEVSIHDGAQTIITDQFFVITASGTSAIDGPISVITAAGQKVLSGSAAEVAPSGKLLGWTISGRGFGHNIGLSQWGAYAMAAQGYTYDRILQFYYPGTTLQ